MSVHLYEFRWITESEMQFQGSRESRFGRKTIKVGDPISLKLSGEVWCAGSSREGEWRACQDRVKGKRKCESCRAREGSFVYTAFDGFNTAMLNAEDLQKISGEHWVYLALFNKNVVKIGVSKAERKTMRQIEQGTHFTQFIAKTPDGTQARQIETLIRQQGLADKVPASQKKEFICPEITEAEGRMVLSELLTRHKSALEAFPQLKNFLLSEPEFVSWSKTYGLSHIEENEKKFHTVQLNKDESISGTIIAAKGPFLVIETPEELVSICAKDLLGRDIDFTPTPPGLKLESALQNSLF